MILSVRKTMLLALIAFMLLLSLATWTVVNPHQGFNVHSHTSYSYTCPPPPFEC